MQGIDPVGLVAERGTGERDRKCGKDETNTHNPLLLEAAR